MPEELVRRLERGVWGQNITGDPTTAMLQVTGPMSYRERVDLLALADHLGYRRAINWLYRRSNGLRGEIIDVEALRALAEAQTQQQRQRARVTAITKHGVFVELESGITGLVRPQEFWSGMREQAQEGQDLEVLVTKVDLERGEVALTTRLPETDPRTKFENGMVVSGKVVNFGPEGAMVELEPDVYGVIPKDELGWTKVFAVPDVVARGDSVTVQIVDVNTGDDPLRLTRRLASERPDVRFPLGSWHEGTIISFGPGGAVIELDRGVRGNVRAKELGFGVAPHFPPRERGHSVSARVLFIEQEDGGAFRVELSLKDPDRNPYAQYTSGDVVPTEIIEVLADRAIGFIENGGTAFFPLAELTWDRRKLAAEVVAVGDHLDGLILTVEPDAERMVLSRTALEPNPYAGFQVGAEYHGLVREVVADRVMVALDAGVEGFIPREELSWFRVNRSSEAVQAGEEVPVRVLECEPDRRWLVLTRRLETEHPEILFPPGSWHDGTVVGLQPYGAFVEIAKGIRGLVPTHEMSYGYVERPEAIVTVDVEVPVRVLGGQFKDRVYEMTLSLRDPDQSPLRQYSSDDRVAATVRRLLDKGVLLELDRGGLGFVPMSELSWDFVRHPGDVVQPGKTVEAIVKDVDPTLDRLIASLKLPEHDWIEFYDEEETYEGTVVEVLDRGVVVSLSGGGTGWVSLGELAWGWVSNPSEEVSVDDSVDVMVLNVDHERRRILLSIKQANKLEPGDWVYGTVIELKSAGAVVDLDEFGTGFLHVSQMADHYVREPSEVVSEGESVHVRLLTELPQPKLSLLDE
jgi:small subunit ribosomal protein S1